MFTTTPQQIAPSYRYFTVDLLSNRVLAEIPFGGVTYERAVKSAGAFMGNIPVITKTEHLDLYENTLPGKTALFVVRDGLCVWGGIIWSRNYDVKSRILNINASEFTSYLYHRRIWKTFNNQFECVVKVAEDTGVGTVKISYGSTAALKAGASVYLEFYEPENFRFNDYYTVADSPTPTVDGFTLASIYKTAKVTAAKRSGTTVTVTTSTPHGFSIDDTVVLTNLGTNFNGSYTVTGVLGKNKNQFTYFDNTNMTPTEATVTDDSLAARGIDEGAYGLVTLTVRTDTYDYIRSLIDGVFKDFVSIDFPNDYIEPGISYSNKITDRKLEYGHATITTEEPHNLAIGQAVQVRDLAKVLDGEYAVTDVPAENQFMYSKSGTLASAPAVTSTTTVTGVALNNGVVTAYGSCPLLYKGRTVKMDCGQNMPGSAEFFTGTFVVSAVASDFSWFQYKVLTKTNIERTNFTNPTATVGGTTRTITGRKLSNNVATITTAEKHGFSVGNTVAVAGITPRFAITEKTYDGGANTGRIITSEPHYLAAGDSVTVSGLRDSSKLVTVRTGTTNVVFTTQSTHNFRTGDSVTISGLRDKYVVSNKALTSNVATLTLATSGNLGQQVGDKVTISDIYDTYAASSKRLNDNVATITTSANHNFKVNDKVTVSDFVDKGTVVSRAVENNIITLGFSDAHNFFPGDQIVVSGLGSPFDGKRTVILATDTQITYKYPAEELQKAIKASEAQFKKATASKDPKQIAQARSVLMFQKDIADRGLWLSPTKANGTVTSTNSIFNGEASISAVTANTFSFQRVGNDVPTTTTPGGQNPTVSGDSVFNGVFTITAATTTSVSYALVANNVTSQAVPKPPEPKNGTDALPQATASTTSVWAGTSRPITGITRNTFIFSYTGTSFGTKNISGSATVNSIFNGTRTVTAIGDNVFAFALTSGRTNILETAVTNKAFVTAPSVFGTGGVITAVTANTFSYARTHTVNIPFAAVPGYGKAVSTPSAIVSTFGPYPGNASIGLEYSTQEYSGANVVPKIYRGFELTNVGEALDQYADNLDGFEYRIDCTFDEAKNKFRKTFVMIPINFPDAPAPGEVSPISRFGADRLVFEYPGNIINVRVTESAENAATRFFAVGETDLGPDAGPQFSVAAANDLLNGKTMTGNPDYREWPLLDDDEKVSNVDDEGALYGFAQRYLNESRPPIAQVSVDVNGSLNPLIGTYGPGDWCSLVVEDNFIKARLATDLEPRDDVLVRKIDSYKVTVPDGTTTPETVTLTLVPEWEVDSIGE